MCKLNRLIFTLAGSLLSLSISCYALTAPTGLDDTDATNTTITLGWDIVADATEYKIYLVTKWFPEDSTYRFAVTAVKIKESNPSTIINATTTHTWSGALQECVNITIGNPDLTHIPDRTELELITIFECISQNIVQMEPVLDLKNLVELNLNDNLLSGEIPSWVSDMSTLEKLFLAGNQFTGSIPATLSNLVNLDTLDLHINRLSGSIPIEITTFTNIRYIALHANQLSGTIPSEIGNLTTLWQLSLYDNQFGGEIPLSLTNLTSLAAGNGLILYSNCNLFSDNQVVQDFIDAKSAIFSGYEGIVASNGHCPFTISIINYLLD